MVCSCFTGNLPPYHRGGGAWPAQLDQINPPTQLGIPRRCRPTVQADAHGSAGTVFSWQRGNRSRMQEAAVLGGIRVNLTRTVCPAQHVSRGRTRSHNQTDVHPHTLLVCHIPVLTGHLHPGRSLRGQLSWWEPQQRPGQGFPRTELRGHLGAKRARGTLMPMKVAARKGFKCDRVGGGSLTWVCSGSKKDFRFSILFFKLFAFIIISGPSLRCLECIRKYFSKLKI